MRREDGAVLIVEAAIVFPIVFMVVFLIFCLGNKYYINACMEKIAKENAIIAANYATNELILLTETDGFTLEKHDVNPYQYSVSSKLKNAMNTKVADELKSSSISLFASMAPTDISDYSGGTNYVKFNWGLFASTATVEIKYNVSPLPLIKNFGIASAEYKAYGVANINDTVEFARNLDLLKDIFTDFTQTEKGKELTGKAAGKVKEIVSKLKSALDFFKNN